MNRRRCALVWPGSFADLKVAHGFSSLVLIFTGAYLALGLVALVVYHLTRNDVWVESYFEVPGAVVLVLLAATELTISLRVMSEFSVTHGMHKAWRLIACSAGCNLASALMIQVLSTKSVLNPLRHSPWWSDSTAGMIRSGGLAVGGPFRFALLAAGLFWVLRVYRQSGFLAKLEAIDWVALGFVGLYVVAQARDVTMAIQRGKHPNPAEILGWPVDPLLWLLLAEGLVLYRSVKQMGQGWISRCWRMFSIGIFLVSVGDISIWATQWGYIPWPWSSLEWYIWIPAAGAFALAPAYQFEAIWQAHGSGRQIQ